jgi:hypothetical protein
MEGPRDSLAAAAQGGEKRQVGLYISRSTGDDGAARLGLTINVHQPYQDY